MDVLVTNTLAAATVTETTTKVNVRTRTQTTEVVSTGMSSMLECCFTLA